jgi:hypothetical protein
MNDLMWDDNMIYDIDINKNSWKVTNIVKRLSTKMFLGAWTIQCKYMCDLFLLLEFILYFFYHLKVFSWKTFLIFSFFLKIKKLGIIFWFYFYVVPSLCFIFSINVKILLIKT